MRKTEPSAEGRGSRVINFETNVNQETTMPYFTIMNSVNKSRCSHKNVAEAEKETQNG